MIATARVSGASRSRRTSTNMKPSQARLRALSATWVTRSAAPIPATASAHSAVTPSATTKVSRGNAVPASCSRRIATPAKSRAASAWLQRMMVSGIASARPFRPQEDADRLEQDQQIEKGRIILGVVEIIFELLAGIVDGGAIGIVDLRPAGHARL